MKRLKLFGNLLIAAVFLYGSAALAQEKPDTVKAKNKMMKHGHQMMRGMKHDSSGQHAMHNMKIIKDSTIKMETHGMKMMMNEKHKMNMDKKEAMNESKSPLIREGVIDVIVIDKNKDGKVFQDTMDWNVISDEAGECPLCGMKLKEVTLEEAKKNLEKNDFKVK